MSRPYAKTSALALCPASIVSKLADVTVAPNSMARKRSPLPMNTVETSRSSTSPSCSRTTPINHKKAMPANGTRPILSRISARRCASA